MQKLPASVHRRINKLAHVYVKNAKKELQLMRKKTAGFAIFSAANGDKKQGG